MLQPYSLLTVADNSGAIEARIILGARGKLRDIRIGDSFTATVKRARPIGQVKKGQVVKAVVVRSRSTTGRADGTSVRFSDNACVIIGADGNPLATRVIGPVAREVRDRGFVKITQLAKEVV